MASQMFPGEDPIGTAAAALRQGARNRRRRRVGQASRLQPRAAAGNGGAQSPVSARRHDHRGAQQPRAVGARRDDHESRACDRSGAAGLESADDGGVSVGVGGAAAIHGVAARGLRAARDVAGAGRRLRRDVVHRQSADARDRPAHRARRRPPGRGVDGRAPRRDAGGHRHRRSACSARRRERACWSGCCLV